MDSNQERAFKRKLEIMANLNGSVTGNRMDKAVKLNHEEFQERLQKGQKFFTKEKLQDFVKDNRARVNKNPELLDKIKKSVDAQLMDIVPVSVLTSTGKTLQFFTIKENPENE